MTYAERGQKAIKSSMDFILKFCSFGFYIYSEYPKFCLFFKNYCAGSFNQSGSLKKVHTENCENIRIEEITTIATLYYYCH